MNLDGFSNTARNALVILAVIAVGATLKSMGAIVSPLLLAIFLAVMIDSFARVIRRHLLPFAPRVAVASAIGASLAILTASAVFVTNNASTFLAKARIYEPRVFALLAGEVGRLGVKAPHTIEQLVAQFDPMTYVGSAAEAVQGFTSSAVLVMIYLGFMLASRHAFERKTVRLFRNRDDRHGAMDVLVRVTTGIERYLWIQTVTGVSSPCSAAC